MEERLVQMDGQGRVVLPKELRDPEKRYYTCQSEPDGTIHLFPVVGVVTSKQAYYWTERWQKGEKRASRDLKAGRGTKVAAKNLEKFFKEI